MLALLTSRVKGWFKAPPPPPPVFTPAPRREVSVASQQRPALPVPGGETQKPAPKPASTRPPLVIASEEDIPSANWKVISGATGEIKLSVRARERLIVIELVGQTQSKVCLVVSIRESLHDTSCKDAVDQCRELGYRAPLFGVADAAFITKLYEGGEPDDALDKVSPDLRPLVGIIDNDLISRAMELHASDIHISLRRSEAIIAMRIHGCLRKVATWSAEQTGRAILVLHLLADEQTKDIAPSDSVGQSMSVTRKIKGVTVKLRVQTEIVYPAGKEIVIRVLPIGVDTEVMSLEKLGYAPGHIMMLNTMLSAPSGVIVISGTTGSGKSTTLQTMMHDIHVANPGMKLYSIEDPPEYILHGVVQIAVRANAYVETMRNTLRLDPDVMMVGELRDAASVELATQIVQSGHKLLTTLHADNTFGILERLARMSLDTATIAGRTFLSGMIYQKLIPVLCTHCRKEYNPDDWDDYQTPHSHASAPVIPASNVVPLRTGDHAATPPAEKKILGRFGIHERIAAVRQTGDLIFVQGDGCAACMGGVSGRSVAAEMVLLTSEMRALILEGKVNEAYKVWRSMKQVGNENSRSVHAMAGMSALDHALIKMRQGLHSPTHVEEELGFLTGYETETGVMDDTERMLLGMDDKWPPSR